MADDFIIDDIVDMDGNKMPDQGDNFAENAKKAGATFRSVFGKSIDRAAMERSAGLRNVEMRERDAFLPFAFMSALAEAAEHPVAKPLLNEKGRKQIANTLESSKQFLGAFEAETGKRIEGRESRHDGALSGHEVMARRKSASPYLRAQARELREEGVCKYLEDVRGRMSEFYHAEENREAAQKKPVKVKGASRGRAR